MKLFAAILLVISLAGCSSSQKEYQVSADPEVCEIYGYDEQYCEAEDPEKIAETERERLANWLGVGLFIFTAISQ